MQLNEEEHKLVVRMSSSGKWDHLWTNLSFMIPSVLLIVVGILQEDAILSFAGLIVILVFYIRNEIYQVKFFPVWKSLCEKISKMTDEREPGGR